ncbi:MAG: HAD-IC family P-type ATPase, partial [Prevotellaceae bacterium]|nr:HAD-IC family P-type ATPase [Prevotellaceae bacterium]
MAHQHKYDAQGRRLCCTLEDKIELRTQNAFIAHEHDDSEEHSHGHTHGSAEGKSTFRMFLPSVISFVLLLTAILFDKFLTVPCWDTWVRPVWYIIAYLPVGFPVLREACEAMLNKKIFTEFFLMSIASIGAFVIGEYPEGIAVMVFYSVGEVFQELAVRKAKGNIKKLLDQRPDTVIVVEGNDTRLVSAHTVGIGAVVQLKPGEKLALDGTLVSERASFNTSALTGESQPDDKEKDDTVLAGMINLNAVAQVEVTAKYNDSKLSRILDMVQNASKQKAKTELFIRKFAKYYTPAVTFAAAAIMLVPALFVSHYVFNHWLYRALVFLVASCPCALVISIPLSYFGGIGAASHKGILFKGGNYFDAMAKIQNVVMDKTGTLTKAVFNVHELVFNPQFNKDELLQWVNVIESKST